MCATYAFGSLLSIVVVQAYKVSATCVLSAAAASAATGAAAWLLRTIGESSLLERSYDADVHAAAMARGAKSFERLEALREVMMREFEAEMAELEQKQGQFEREMRSVEERHQSQVSRLEMEISRLKEQNKNAAADKAKALEQAVFGHSFRENQHSAQSALATQPRKEKRDENSLASLWL